MIQEGSKVKFDYTLTVEGKVEDTSAGRGPLEYTHGAGQIIKGLEILKHIEDIETDNDDRPLKKIVIINCGEILDKNMEDYKDIKEDIKEVKEINEDNKNEEHNDKDIKENNDDINYTINLHLLCLNFLLFFFVIYLN